MFPRSQARETGWSRPLFRNVPESASMSVMAEPAPDRPPRPSRVTIREVAELAGVSIATVSRVLNGRDDVSRETRELVSAIVKEQGYSANRSARSLSAGRPGPAPAPLPLVFPP